MQTLKINQNFQVTIPKYIREEIGLLQTDVLKISVMGDSIILEKKQADVDYFRCVDLLKELIQIKNPIIIIGNPLAGKTTLANAIASEYDSIKGNITDRFIPSDKVIILEEIEKLESEEFCSWVTEAKKLAPGIIMTTTNEHIENLLETVGSHYVVFLNEGAERGIKSVLSINAGGTKVLYTSKTENYIPPLLQLFADYEEILENQDIYFISVAKDFFDRLKNEFLSTGNHDVLEFIEFALQKYEGSGELQRYLVGTKVFLEDSKGKYTTK